MFSSTPYDSTWRDITLKQEGEDEFVLPFDKNLGMALDKFAREGREISSNFAPRFLDKKEDDEQYAPAEQSIKAFYDLTDEIYNFMNRMRLWFVSFANNKRETITGSEYWALVDVLEQIRERLIMDSEITQDNIAKYGPTYRANLKLLNRSFVDMDFAMSKSHFMQPLYAEILKQRTVHKMNIFI